MTAFDPRSLMIFVGLSIACSTIAEGNFIIAGPTNGTPTSISIPDPANPGFSMTDAILLSNPGRNVIYQPAPTALDAFSQTFYNDINGWTLNYGGGLGGTLQVNTYTATQGNIPGTTTPGFGAEMNATYMPAASDPNNLTFVQYYVSSIPDGQPGGGTHIDNGLSKPSPLYYTPQLMLNNGLTFKDNPQDPQPTAANQGQTYTETFYTYLCTFDNNTQSLTVYDGWKWGYSTGYAMPFVIVTSVPEPASFVSLGIGMAGVVGWQLRRHGRGFSRN